MGDIGQFFPHDFLRFHHISGYPGNWSIISNRAGKNDINVLTHAGVHDTAGQNLLFDGRLNSAYRPQQVNRAQMILVTDARQRPFQAYAAGGPK